MTVVLAQREVAEAKKQVAEKSAPAKKKVTEKKESNK